MLRLSAWRAVRIKSNMDINPRLYVEIHPFDGPHSPHPHPITEGHFDPDYVYKVLGMYNPSETSECYFVLANPQRQIWFIPQRHLLAFRMIDSDEFFLPKSEFKPITNRSEAQTLADRRSSYEPTPSR
jgi:hypothetical protein